MTYGHESMHERSDPLRHACDKVLRDYLPADLAICLRQSLEKGASSHDVFTSACLTLQVPFESLTAMAIEAEIEVMLKYIQARRN